MITHLAALAAAHPAHVSNAQYAASSWTPGGMTLGAIILAVLIFAWIKIPSGPKVTARRKPQPAAKAWRRAQVPSPRR